MSRVGISKPIADDRRNPVRNRLGWIALIAAGALFLGPLCYSKYPILRPSDFWKGLLWSMIFLPPIALMAFARRQRGTEYEQVMAPTVLATSISVVIIYLYIAVWMYPINGFFDNSQPEVHRVTVLRRWANTQGGRAGWVHFSLFFTDWRGPEICRVDVSQDFYEGKKLNDQFDVMTRRGLFGLEWIAGYR